MLLSTNLTRHHSEAVHNRSRAGKHVGIVEQVCDLKFNLKIPWDHLLKDYRESLYNI